jgi:hypothetical protein
VIGSQWVIHRGLRLLAAVSFWAVALSANALYAGCCIAPDSYLLVGLVLGWAVIVLPAIVSFGTAWAVLGARARAVPRRSVDVSAPAVFLLAMLPILTLGTMWPLRIGFLAARPALERLADKVAAGKAVTLPQQVGLFRLVKSAVDPVSGNVALITDANPSGPKGFVRGGSAYRANPAGPIVGSNLNIGLGGGWDYRDED